MASSWAGNDADAPTPYPAVLLAPSATIWAWDVVVAAQHSRQMRIKCLNMSGRFDAAKSVRHNWALCNPSL
jgi:hypothetical protein